MFKKQDFFFTFDLKSAYHIEISKEHRAFYAFHGKLKGQFIVLRFGTCITDFILA